MTKFTHTVTRKQFLTASDNWHRIMNRELSPRNGQYAYFITFIGSSSYDRVYSGVESYINCTERAYNKIEMLNSPHARTLLKAFKAKYGYHKDIP